MNRKELPLIQISLKHGHQKPARESPLSLVVIDLNGAFFFEIFEFYAGFPPDLNFGRVLAFF